MLQNPLLDLPDVMLKVPAYSIRVNYYKAAAEASEQDLNDWYLAAIEAHAKRCLKDLYVPPREARR